MNREAYLTALVEKVRPRFFALGAPFPETLHLSVGFPSKGGLAKKKRAIGECWDASASADGRRHIFISPLLSDVVDVGATLVHELAHAALPDGIGHTKPFAGLAKQLGLEGKPTSTTAGSELRMLLAGFAEQLGPYPHAELSHVAFGGKVQTTRMLKTMCPVEGCGYTTRLSRHWLDVGAPICPVHMQPCAEAGAPPAGDLS